MQHELLEKIRKHYESEQYMEIIYACRELSPTDEHYHYLLKYRAMAYYYLDMYQKSEEAFRILHEKSPDNTDFLKSLITLLDKQDEYKKIIKLIEESGSKILEDYTMQEIYHDSYMNLVKQYLEEHNFYEILKCFDIYEQYCPDDDKMIEYKIRFLEEHNMYEEALREYDKLFAIEKRHSYLEINDKIRCQESSGLYYYKIGQLRKAYDSYSRALGMYHKMDEKERRKITESWYSEILTKNLEKHKDNPERFFKEFFTFNEDTEEIWFDKLYTINVNRENNVIDYCDNLLKSENSPKLWKYKAHTYHNPQRALDSIEEVLKMGQDDKEAIKDKIKYLYQLHRFDEAITFIDNTPPEYLDIQSLFLTIGGLIDSEMYDEAVKCNYKVLEINPECYEVVRNIKEIEEKSGKNYHENTQFYMKWIEKIQDKVNKGQCPECKSEMIPIIYGYPTEAGFRRADRGEIILGGCCVDNYSPTHYCLKCQKRLRQEHNGLIIDKTDKLIYKYIDNLLVDIRFKIGYSGMKRVEYLKEYLSGEEYLDDKEIDMLMEKLITLKFITIVDDELIVTDENNGE